jgi:hypothetical protein
VGTKLKQPLPVESANTALVEIKQGDTSTGESGGEETAVTPSEVAVSVDGIDVATAFLVAAATGVELSTPRDL